MKIFAISDLHLPGGQEKPMNVFGNHWEDHFGKISRDWRERVGDEDLVLLPGDLSWAMRLDEALADINAVGALPGIKVILRGNHDLWWGGIGQLRSCLPEKMFAIQNDALRIGDTVICGTRGWLIPGEGTPQADRKIFDREVQRLRLSLDSAERLGGDRRIIMTHYPPFNERYEDSPFSELIDSIAPCDVVYGHLHGQSLRGAFNGMRHQVRYTCVSCDGLGFCLADITAPPV